MIILKSFGIILAVIFALLIFVLLIPAKVRLWTDENKKLNFSVKYLFLNINNQKKKEKNKSDSSPKKEKDNIFKTYLKKYGFTETVSKILELLSDALSELSFILSKAKFKKIHLKIICATEDASKTALSYGHICSVVYPFTALMDSKLRISKDAFDINIGCDFNTDKFDFSFDLEVSLLSLVAVISAVKLFTKFKKLF